MAGKNTLEIVIKGQDKASPAFKQAGKSADDMAKKATRSLGGMGSALQSVWKIAAGFLSAQIFVKLAATVKQFVSSLVQAGVELEGVRKAFAGISGDASGMLAALREGSLGLVRDTDLMKSYNLAAQLVSKSFADDLPEAMGYLTKVSAATGQSMDYMMDSLVRGVGRMSPLILDNLGVQVSLEEATARAAKTFGVEAEALTDTQIQGELMNLVMEKLAVNTANMPSLADNASTGWKRLGVSLANLRDELGARLMPLLGDIGSTLSSALAKVGPAIEGLATGVFESLRGVGSVFTSFVRSLAEAMGIDMDNLATDARTWGENIAIQLANGIASATLWVVRALNSIGTVIAEWLAPGSPPKLLPEIDEWGRDAILEYLGGMEQVTEADARQALEGIRRYYDDLLNPINFRLSEIGNERQDITDSYNIGLLEKRLKEGFTNPQAKRMAELRLEELKLQMQARGLELERDKSMTAAERKLADALKANTALVEQADALKASKSAADSAAAAAEAYAEANKEAAASGTTLTESVNRIAEAVAKIFEPVKTEAETLGTLWGTVFDGMKKKVDDLFGPENAAAVGLKISGALKEWTDKLLEWSESDATQATVSGIGEAIATFVVGGLVKFLGLDTTAAGVSDTTYGMLYQAVMNVGEGVFNLGVALGQGLFRGIVVGLTGKTVEQSVEDAMQNAARQAAEENRPWWQDLMRKYGAWWSTLPPWLSGIGGYASGGDFITNGPRLIMVGEAGPERVQVTPVNNYNLNVTTQQQSMGIMADFATMQLMGA